MIAAALLLAAQTSFPTPFSQPQVASFGDAVAIDFDLMAVGASGYAGSVANRRPGRVTVFDVSTGLPAAQDSVTGLGVAIGDGFGEAVDIDAGLAAMIVGAPGFGGGRGAAFLFERGGSGQWNQVARFDGPAGRTGFGADVALEGGIAVVGQPDFDGGVWTFRRELSGWIEVGALALPPTVFPGAEFGAALALDGGVLAVGAPGEDSLGYDSGAVYVYRQTGAPAFQLFDRVEHPSAATVTQHGIDVAVDMGNATGRLLVGSGDGKAFLWTSVGFGPFTELGVLTAYDGTDGGFGRSVALHGERAVIGAPFGTSDGSSSGAAFPFALDDGGFTPRPLSMLHPAAGGVVDSFARFGDAVAIGDTLLAVGSPRNGDQGTLYAFEPGARLGEAYCIGEPNSDGARGTLSVGGSDLAADQTLTLRAAGLPAGAAALPLVAPLRDFVPGVGGGQGNLCLGGSIVRLNGLITFARALGRVDVDIDFAALPPGFAPTAGSTWCFQVWYRDDDPGPTSNTTDAVSVTLR